MLLTLTVLIIVYLEEKKRREKERGKSVESIEMKKTCQHELDEKMGSLAFSLKRMKRLQNVELAAVRLTVRSRETM